mmetsp:Transcript_27008/g.57222  ORF Transcript_27008/g.57222 Transcript_27008/m.57222 type:complete len:340 (+) Transcript_27008:63-1082(+)
MKRKRKASGTGGAGGGAEKAAIGERLPKRKAGAKRKGAAKRKAAAKEEVEPQEKGAGDEIDVEFDFCDPDEEDYHSVSGLLKSGTWEFLDLNFSELADSVVGQGNIGSLIKSDSSSGDSDKDATVSGMLTTLNLRQFAHLSWPKAIGTALLERAKKHGGAAVAEKLQALLEAAAPRKGASSGNSEKEVGLLLSERFINLPLELIPALHKAMKEDIDWSCETPECPPEERPFYGFTHFLGVARCQEAGPVGAASAEATGGGKKKRKQMAAPAAIEGGLIFERPEDMAYARRASWSFSFPLAVVEGRSGPKDRRFVFGITRKNWERAVAEVHACLAEAEGA